MARGGITTYCTARGAQACPFSRRDCARMRELRFSERVSCVLQCLLVVRVHRVPQLDACLRKVARVCEWPAVVPARTTHPRRGSPVTYRPVRETSQLIQCVGAYLFHTCFQRHKHTYIPRKGLVIQGYPLPPALLRRPRDNLDRYAAPQSLSAVSPRILF